MDISASNYDISVEPLYCSFAMGIWGHSIVSMMGGWAHFGLNCSWLERQPGWVKTWGLGCDIEGCNMKMVIGATAYDASVETLS